MSEKQPAADFIPVSLSVLERSNGLVLSRAADRPPGLGNPDLLVADSGLGLLNGLLEQGLGVVDGIGHCVLEVRVAIEADEVASIDDGLVGTIHPGGPGIDVADGHGKPAVRKSRSDLVDVRRNGVGARADTRVGLDADHRVAVQIFATDADPGNATGEGIAILVNGGFEGRDLAIDGLLAGRGPDTEEERGVLSDGSGDSRDGAVVSAALLYVEVVRRHSLSVGREVNSPR